MLFNYSYVNAMDTHYHAPAPDTEIEGTIKYPISAIGKSITEGRAGGGTFLDSLKSAIWEGASQVELSTQMEGGEPFVGVESYGKTGREELRKLAEVNKINLTSVHSPSQIGNLAGYAGPERGFDDSYREMQVNEIRKAIEFAADVNAPAVVVHTGEYQRPIIDQQWARDDDGTLMFRHYEEEKERAVVPLVDRRTGNVIMAVRKNQLLPRAEWEKYDESNKMWEQYGGKPYRDENGQWVSPGDYINYEGYLVEDLASRVPKYDPKTNKFVVRNYVWEDFVQEAEIRNKLKEKQLGRNLNFDERILPEEAFIQASTETQEKIALGWAGTYGDELKRLFTSLDALKKAQEFYKKVEKGVPEDELWKLKEQAQLEISGHARDALKFIPPKHYLPSELIAHALKEVRDDIDSRKEMVLGQQQSAQEARNTRDHAISVGRYAKNKTTHSYATLGIFAMNTTDERKLKKPVFVAPEHIWPEMGYGSHPDELIELVQKSRERMVKYLTEKKIEDPSGKLDTEGKPWLIDNPHYKQGVSRHEAMKEAQQHIKSTFDTQHLGMWWRHWVPKPGESMDDTRKRFEGWYMDQVKKMEKAGILGHIHIVDGWGRGHTHLPPGEGTNPITTAIDYLKKKGYEGAIISEAYGEAGGQQRQLIRTWENFGNTLYNPRIGPIRPPAGPEPGRGRWMDIWQSYFGKTKTPYYIFGQYSPSEDWTLWTQVPME